MSRLQRPPGKLARRAATWAGAIALLLAAVGVAIAVRGQVDPGTSGPAANVAPLDQAYKFDANGPLPLQGQAQLPVAPGSVVAHWYTFRGWQVVLFEGLDLGMSGPLCVGTSVLNAATHQVEHLSNSPTAAGACDPRGAGQVVLAPTDRGVRACGAEVAFITGIPAEITGVRYASLTTFRGDGTGLAISSRLETTERTGELDASSLSCGQLPVARLVPAPTPTPEPAEASTPAPASTGTLAAADRPAPPTPTRPSTCAPVESGALDEVTGSGAAPYLIHRPTANPSSAPTVVFLGGGSGGRASAERLWEIVFAGRPEADRFQVVLPYSIDANFIDEAPRTLAIVNEVLACYGGDAAEVHLAGTSNGGLAAFALMAGHPDRFATLLGAPGAFPVQDPATMDAAVLARTLAGRAVFNGVGARDSAWKPEVIATHNALVGAGIESMFVEFPDQGHILGPTLDPSPFFDFWDGH